MRGRWTSCALLLALALSCMLWADAARGSYDAAFGGARVSYGCADSVEFSRLTQLRRQIAMTGRGTVTGWAQALSVMVEFKLNAASALVDAVYIDGDAALAYRPRMVSGDLPAQGDHIGCALDEATALTLFGSTDVVGKEVLINGKAMEVRGVFVLEDRFGPGRGLALCPAALADDSLKPDALELILWLDGGGTPLEQAKTLLAEAGIGGSGTFNDHADERRIMEMLSALPSVLFQLMFLTELFWAMRKLAVKRVPRRATWLPGALFWALLIAAIILLPGVPGPPPSMMPSRWSDFAFWPGLLTSWRESAAQLMLTGCPRPRLIELSLFAGALVSAMLSALFILYAWRALRRLINHIV